MSTIRNSLKVLSATVALFVALATTAGATTQIAGTATYYNDAGYGACGTQINAATEMLVAIPAAYWTTANPNNDPLCQKTINVTYQGRTLTLPIKDKCPSCDASHIDLSQPAFEQFAPTGVGVIQVDWNFN